MSIAIPDKIPSRIVEELTALSPTFINACAGNITKAVVAIRKILTVTRSAVKPQIERLLATIDDELNDITTADSSDEDEIADVLERWAEAEALVDAAVEYVELTDREHSVATEMDYDRLRRAVEEYAR